MAKTVNDSLITAFGELFLLIDEGFSAQRLDGYLARFQSMISGMSIPDILEQQRQNRVALGLEQALPPGQVPLTPGVKPSLAGAGRGGQGGPSAEQLSGTGGFGATPEATLKAVAESEKRLRESNIASNRNLALRGANDIMAIEINTAAEIARAREEIFSKERLTDEQKTAEFAAKRREIQTKADNDIAKSRSQLNAKVYTEQSLLKNWPQKKIESIILWLPVPELWMKLPIKMPNWQPKPNYP
jgi:hypothetical protein